MSNTKSILIFLNNYLDIYSINSTSQAITKIFERSSDQYLNLADHIENIWVEHIDPISAKKFYLVLGPQAGFTDTRMVHMWLKTSEQMSGASFYTHQSSTPIKFDGFSFADIIEYLKPIELENSQKLTYSKPPRIG